MSLSLIKYNLVHLWPDRVVFYQKSWLPFTTYVKQREYKLGSEEHKYSLLNIFSEYLSQLPAWQATTIVVFGEKVKYRLIQHQLELSPDEFHVLVEHQLRKILGKKSNEWLYFVQETKAGDYNFGVAIEAEWLDKIKSCIKNERLRFTNIQPSATWLLNQIRIPRREIAWCIIKTPTELFFFKFDNFKLIYFKHILIRPDDMLEVLIERELMSCGDDIDSAILLINDMDTILKATADHNGILSLNISSVN